MVLIAIFKLYAFTNRPSNADFKIDFLSCSAFFRELSIAISTLSITEKEDSIIFSLKYNMLPCIFQFF